MISALTFTVHAIGVTAGLLLGSAPEQAAAVLAAIALGTHALLRRHRARRPGGRLLGGRLPGGRRHLPAATSQRAASALRRRAASAR